MIIGLAIPLVLRRIGSNRRYGIRYRKAFRSEESWYEINAFGGRQILIWAVPIVAAGFAILFIPVADPPSLLQILLLGGGPVVVFLPIPVLIIHFHVGKIEE